MLLLVSTNPAGLCVPCAEFTRGCPPPGCGVDVLFQTRSGFAEHCGFKPWSGSQELRYKTLTVSGSFTRTLLGVTATGSVFTTHTYENDCSISCVGTITRFGSTTAEACTSASVNFGSCLSAREFVAAIAAPCDPGANWLGVDNSATSRTETLTSNDEDPEFCASSGTVEKVLGSLRPISETIDKAITTAEGAAWVTSTSTTRCAEMDVSQPLSTCGAGVIYKAARIRFINPNPGACPSIRVLWDLVDNSSGAPVTTAQVTEIAAPLTESPWIDLLVDPGDPFGTRLCATNIRAEPL